MIYGQFRVWSKMECMALRYQMNPKYIMHIQRCEAECLPRLCTVPLDIWVGICCVMLQDLFELSLSDHCY